MSSHRFDGEDALRIFELYDLERNKRFEKLLPRLGCFELNKPCVETLNQKHWYDYFKTGAVSPECTELPLESVVAML